MAEDLVRASRHEVAVAAVVALIMYEVIPNPLQSHKDDEAFEACRDVSDYRGYIELYGEEAIHYAEAMEFIDNYVADSIEEVEKAKADGILSMRKAGRRHYYWLAPD